VNYVRKGDFGLETPGYRYIDSLLYILRVIHNEIGSLQPFVGTHDWRWIDLRVTPSYYVIPQTKLRVGIEVLIKIPV
jgi:hypothetical protein